MSDQLELIAQFLCRLGRDATYYAEVAAAPQQKAEEAGIDVEFPPGATFEMYSQEFISTHLYSMLLDAETRGCQKWLNQNDPPIEEYALRSAPKGKKAAKKGAQKKAARKPAKKVAKKATRKPAKKAVKKPSRKTAKKAVKKPSRKTAK